MDPFYKVDFGKIVSVAQAPVSLVIATSIFLHMLTSRYVPLYDRVRALTDEYRNGPKDGSRQRNIELQIRLYAKRITLTQMASGALNLAVITFLGTVGLSAIIIIFPGTFSLRLAGMVTMAIGILLLVAAVILEIYEDVISRQVFRSEISEFPEI